MKHQEYQSHCKTGVPRRKLTTNHGPILVTGWSATALWGNWEKPVVRRAGSGAAFALDPGNGRRWLSPIPIGRGGPCERGSSGIGP